ncbi:MAG: hypothetical protein WA988_07210 [Candidatus Nanopelagicales bacterium]
MISVLGELELPDLTSLDLPDPLAEYLAIRREHGQVLNLLAVIDGSKPCLDDWIPVAAIDRYLAMCDRFGLTVRSGVQFDVMSHEDAEQTVGSGTLTTTRARARELGDARGSVHVFVGRDPDAVAQTFNAGWYPLVVGERATSKPWIDHIWFGEGLGYPTCCLEAFAHHNNWSVNNMPYKAARNTAQPHMLCNSIMRFTGLTWAPHLPCRYDCPATIEQSSRLRQLTLREAPALVPVVDGLCTGRFLLLSEWEGFAFHRAEPVDGGLSYEAVSLVPSNRPNLALFEALQRGDRCEVRDDLVVVFAGDQVVWVERCRADGFAPRVPVMMSFGDTEQ